MGCDIHIVLERKDKDRDCWVGARSYKYFAKTLLAENYEGHYAGFIIKQRNYAFFNDLCGVRGDGSKFGYTPKGLPEDASSMTLFELGDDTDLHSHSWVTMQELHPVMAKHFGAALVKRRLTDQHAPDVLRTYVDDDIGDAHAPLEDWRLVFAFDN